MKYNRVGIVAMFMATLIITLSSTAARADREREDEDTTSTGEKISEEHRSTVGTFVQNILKTADKEERKNIGEQLRQVAREEDESEATTTEAIKKIEDRSSFKTFLIGTDYKNIGMLRSRIAKTQARIDQLTRLLDSISSSTTSTVSASTTEQLESLKQTETKLTNFVTENESKFSLFGWFVRLFSK